MNIQHILVCGGDTRQLYAADALIKKNFHVIVTGFDQSERANAFENAVDFHTAMAACEAVILPLPASRDGETVNLPLSEHPIALETFLSALRPGQTVFAGLVGAQFRERLEKRGVQVIDYYAREELITANAVPTAEGTLKVIIESTPGMVQWSHAAVTGFGRTAKALVRVLTAVGANVTVFARRSTAWAQAQAWGCAACPFQSLPALAGTFDFIVNTVPACVIDEPVLRRIQPDCPVIDIASPPGGVDLEAAKRCAVRVIPALSLPGKYAPKTAGEIIADTIANLIRGEEYA